MVRSFTILLLLGLLVPCMVALDPMIEQALEEAKDPTPLVFVEEGDSTSLIELGVKGQKCANGYYCPMENGVCCKTGNVCCDSACANDDNGSPTCDLTPLQKAMVVARAKMQYEAKQELLHEKHLKAKGEAAEKRKKEAAQKDVEEEANKKKRNVAENKEKTERQKAEEAQKKEGSKAEAQKKAADRANAKKANEGKTKAEQLTKSQRLVDYNKAPKQKTVLRTNAALRQSNQYSYCLWIYPQEKNRHWSNIIHKGNRNIDRNIAIWFYPGSFRLHIRSSSAKSWNSGLDHGSQLKPYAWTHVCVSHAVGGVLRVYYNGNQVMAGNVGKPVFNTGNMWLGDPWHHAAKALVSDFRYWASIINPTQIRQFFGQKRFKHVEIQENTLFTGHYRPQKNRQLVAASNIKASSATTWMFWVKPYGISRHWMGLIHRGLANNQRNPAVWFYPSSTRLHIRSGTRRSWNDGTDPGQHLALFRWTHVAFTHEEGHMKVYYNGKLVSHHRGIPAPVHAHSNAPLRGCGPWYHGHPSVVSDIRYAPRVLTEQLIRRAMGKKHFPSKYYNGGLVVVPRPYVPRRGHVVMAAHRFKWSVATTYTFWIRATGRIGAWSNIFHKGENNHIRRPAIWFYPGHNRLHIRAGTRRSWNDGGDPGPQIPHSWTHVAVSHSERWYCVWYNSRRVYCTHSHVEPYFVQHPMRSSDPWHHVARCVISDLRYFDVALGDHDVKQIMGERKHR